MLTALAALTAVVCLAAGEEGTAAGSRGDTQSAARATAPAPAARSRTATGGTCRPTSH